MTCIAGLIENGRGYLASDSLGGNGHTQDLYRNAKVFKKGPMLIGYTSSYRMGQLLEHKLALPARMASQSTDNYVYVDFVDAVRTLMKDNGFAKVENNREAAGEFLFILDGRLFTMQADLSVLESKNCFDACGSGEDYARATLACLRGSKVAPRDKVRRAVRIASEFVSTVGGDVHIVSSRVS